MPRNIGFLPIRVGVEYLPDEQNLSDSSLFPMLAKTGKGGPVITGSSPRRKAVAVRPQGRDAPDEPPRPSFAGRLELPLFLDESELQDISKSEQLTMKFVQDLVGEDRRRMHREFGAPVLTTRLYHRISPALVTQVDERTHEEESLYINDVARRLVRRPLRNVLKGLTIIEDMEIALQSFKAKNVPYSGAYQENRGRSSWGRVSMRLKLHRDTDRVEISYRNFGARVATSPEHLRFTYGVILAENVQAHFRFQFEYDEHDTEVWANLQYNIDENTQLHLHVGDRMHFLSGPTAYSSLGSPIDGEPGLMFYVEHLF